MTTNNRIRIHVINVGHGDSLLVEFPDGPDGRPRFGLVDAGGEPAGSITVVGGQAANQGFTAVAGCTHRGGTLLAAVGQFLQQFKAAGIGAGCLREAALRELAVTVIGQRCTARPVRFPPGTDVFKLQPGPQFQVGLQRIFGRGTRIVRLTGPPGFRRCRLSSSIDRAGIRRCRFSRPGWRYRRVDLSLDQSGQHEDNQQPQQQHKAEQCQKPSQAAAIAGRLVRQSSWRGKFGLLRLPVESLAWIHAASVGRPGHRPVSLE